MKTGMLARMAAKLHMAELLLEGHGLFIGLIILVRGEGMSGTNNLNQTDALFVRAVIEGR